jgi:hypothetical protein
MALGARCSAASACACSSVARRSLAPTDTYGSCLDRGVGFADAVAVEQDGSL